MLTFAILLPLIGSLVLAFAPRLDGSVARASAVGTSVLPLAALVMVSLDFDASGAQFQAVAETEWIPALGVAWRVGVDGIALALALMTALLFLAAVAWPAETQGRARQYYAWFLFLEGASLGVFLTLDLLVFYVFFDLSLVGMYFLIGRWGHGDAAGAALTFFVYTMPGSLALLLAILALVVAVRSDELRVGKGCVCTCRSRWQPAYVLRISDWSSDVCSSDLRASTTPGSSSSRAPRWASS